MLVGLHQSEQTDWGNCFYQSVTTTPIPAAKRVTQQKAAALGSLHAAIVGNTPGSTLSGPFFVLFWDDQGRATTWPLDGVSANGWDASCALLPTVPGSILPGYIVVATKDLASRTIIQEFRLPADPFAAAPTPNQSAPPLGDGQSRQTEFVYLPASGELVVMTQQHDAAAFYASIRTASGVWINQPGLIQISTTKGTSFQFTSCLAPWAPLVWAADMVDGGSGIDAATFKVNNGRLLLSQTYPQVINGSMGSLAANGEDPALVAVTDAVRGQVALSYTNREWVPGIDQQAFPVVAGIKPGMAPTQIAKASEVVISILNPCPVCVQPSGVTLSYPTGRPQNMLHCSGQSIPIDNALFAFSTTTRDFVVSQAGVVSLVRVDTIDVQPTPPPINTAPSVSIVAIWLQLSAYAADAEDGALGSKVVWTSDAAGYLGTGAQVQVTVPRKDQLITATITDSQGLTSSDSIGLKFKLTKG